MNDSILKIFFLVSQERTVLVNRCFVVRTRCVWFLQQSKGGGSGIDSVNPA